MTDIESIRLSHKHWMIENLDDLSLSYLVLSEQNHHYAKIYAKMFAEVLTKNLLRRIEYEMRKDINNESLV